MNIEIELESCITYTVLISLVMFIVYGLTFVVQDARVHLQCLDYGYANHSVAWNLRAYCIREENEYEIVKPLSELISNEK